MAIGIIYLTIIGLGVVAGIISGVVLYRKKKAELPVDPFVDNEAPLETKTAVIEKKSIGKQLTGSYHVPNHRILYIVRFLTEQGAIELNVDDEVYEELNIGDSGTLIYQNNRFLGFEHD